MSIIITPSRIINIGRRFFGFTEAKIYQGLYANLTNRCFSACTFCLRQNTDHIRLYKERSPLGRKSSKIGTSL